ncbi:MAG TPA: MFS transporter [Rectinemataceae bacterium]|nr:MFS transporter [Rectinemataceae bacterium]
MHSDVKPSYKWLALSCTSLGTLMASLNGGTLIIAIPDLMRVLRADLLSAVWILIVYQLIQTVLVLTAGRLADMIGRKRLYVAGFALFGVASLIAGFCTNAWELIVMRGVQGAAGAFMIANSSAIVTDAFPRERLGLALGTNMIVFAVGNIIGTILGGWLVTVGWEWVFWFNVPISIIGTIWAAANLRELSTPDASREHDVAGMLAYMVGMTGLLIALTAGGIDGWLSPMVVSGFIAAALGLPLFFFIEKRSGAPMIDLKLFKHPPFTLGNVAAFFNAIARSGITMLFVFYYQGPKGFDAITAGLLLTPVAASMLVASPLSGLLADRYGSRILSLIGLILTTFGLGMMMFIKIDSSFAYVLASMIVMGLGSGFFNSPNTRLVMTSAPANRRGIAAGTRSMLINSGSVFSIALVLALVTSGIDPKVLFSIFAGVTSGLPASALSQFTRGFETSFAVLALISLLSVAIGLLPHQAEEDEEGHVIEHDAGHHHGTAKAGL